MEISDNGIGFEKLDMEEKAFRKSFSGDKPNWTGGAGNALKRDYGLQLIRKSGGTREVDTRRFRSPQEKSWRLTYDPSRQGQEFQMTRIKGREVGTAIRWRVPNIFTAGLEEGNSTQGRAGEFDPSSLTDLEESPTLDEMLEKAGGTFADQADVLRKVIALQAQLRSLTAEEKIFIQQWLWAKQALPKEMLRPADLERLPADVAEGQRAFSVAPKILGTEIWVVKDRRITPADLKRLEIIFDRIHGTDQQAYSQLIEQTRLIGLFKLGPMESSVFIGPFGFTGLSWPNPWKSFIGNRVDDYAASLIWAGGFHELNRRYRERDLVRNSRFRFPHYQSPWGNELTLELTPYLYLWRVQTGISSSRGCCGDGRGVASSARASWKFRLDCRRLGAGG